MDVYQFFYSLSFIWKLVSVLGNTRVYLVDVITFRANESRLVSLGIGTARMKLNVTNQCRNHWQHPFTTRTTLNLSISCSIGKQSTSSIHHRRPFASSISTYLPYHPRSSRSVNTVAPFSVFSFIRRMKFKYGFP